MRIGRSYEAVEGHSVVAGGEFGLGWRRLGATVCSAAVLFGICEGESAAQRESPHVAVFSGDAAAVEAVLDELERKDTVEAWLSTWLSKGPRLGLWYGEVLRGANPDARQRVTDMVGVVANVYFFVTPELLDFVGREGLGTTPGDIFMRELGRNVGVPVTIPALEWVFPPDADDTEVRALAGVFARQLRSFYGQLPILLREEYGRWLVEEPGERDSVLRRLFEFLVYLRLLGSEEERAALWDVWMERRAAEGLRTEVRGLDAPWRLLSVYQIRHGIDEAVYPVEGRVLPLDVRYVATRVLEERGGDAEMSAAAAYLLAEERPLDHDVVRRLYDVRCGSSESECVEVLRFLYAGEDDVALNVIHADVGAYLAGLLKEMQKARGSMCRELIALRQLAEASVTVEGSTEAATDLAMEGVREGLESVSERIRSALLASRLVDDLSSELLDRVDGMWLSNASAEERQLLEERRWLGHGPPGAQGRDTWQTCGAWPAHP